MSSGSKDVVKSRKIGSEDAIVVQLPADRFLSGVPAHCSPPIDRQGCFSIMILAQDCSRVSFGDADEGSSQELHLWLQVGSSTDDPRIDGADVMLPSKHWIALFAAADKAEIGAYLRSFGFDPGHLASVNRRAGGGSLGFPDGTRIEWTIAGPGRGPVKVGVHHVLFMPSDKPDATGHRVAALITDAVMEQPGELHVHTSVLEPILLPGERLSAVVHRMPRLEADVVWRRRSRT